MFLALADKTLSKQLAAEHRRLILQYTVLMLHGLLGLLCHLFIGICRL